MTYTKLPDEFTEDPRVVALSDRAFRLHVSSFVYANRNLTDGLLPSGVVGMLMPRQSKTAVEELVAAGLWSKTPDGYVITDFHRHQLGREQVLALRSARSDAGRIGGLRSADTRRSRSAAAARPKAIAEASAEAKPYPGPVPVPVRERSVLASLERVQSAQPDEDEDESAGAIVSPEIVETAEQIIATASEPWRSALIRLRSEMPANNFATWFTKTYLVAHRMLAVPNSFAAEWLGTKYARQIASALDVPTVDIIALPDEVRGWFAGTIAYAVRTGMNPAIAWRIGVVDVLDRLASDEQHAVTA